MSVTAVPLHPISKGSLSRLWIGVIVAALVGIALAWAGSSRFGTTASGLKYQVIEPGAGPSPTKADFALIGYTGTLDDGTVFDQNERAPMEIGNTVPGFAEALTMMKKGGHMRVHIPAALAYGASPPPGSPIPANADLTFDIRLIEFKTKAEVEALQQQMQLQRMLQSQMQQQQGGAGIPGAPTGAMPEAPPVQ